MQEFLDAPENSGFRDIFLSFHITLVCDGLALSGAQKTAFRAYLQENKLTHINWSSFLLRTKQMHQDFLDESTRQRKSIGK